MHGSPLPLSGNKLFWVAIGVRGLALLAIRSSSIGPYLNIKCEQRKDLRQRVVKFFVMCDRICVLRPRRNNFKEHF